MGLFLNLMPIEFLYVYFLRVYMVSEGRVYGTKCDKQVHKITREIML